MLFLTLALLNKQIKRIEIKAYIYIYSQNPNQNLTPKTLRVTNVIKRDIHPVSAKSIPNYMSSK
jgi:hypothetical protein